MAELLKLKIKCNSLNGQGSNIYILNKKIRGNREIKFLIIQLKMFRTKSSQKM